MILDEADSMTRDAQVGTFNLSFNIHLIFTFDLNLHVFKVHKDPKMLFFIKYFSRYTQNKFESKFDVDYNNVVFMRATHNI